MGGMEGGGRGAGGAGGRWPTSTSPGGAAGNRLKPDPSLLNSGNFSWRQTEETRRWGEAEGGVSRRGR